MLPSVLIKGQRYDLEAQDLKRNLCRCKFAWPDGAHQGGNDLAGWVVGLYFSAHWCPPCRGFTPQLANYYASNLKAKGLEIVGKASRSILVNRKRKDQLSSLCKIGGSDVLSC